MTKLALEELRERPVTQIVSLGTRCATTYNLRRHFNFGTAMPFDWWVTPAPGLRAILADFDIDYLYDPDQLELTGDGCSVGHVGLGVILHHEFPRDTSKPDEPLLPNFLDHLDSPRRRTIHLRDRLFRANRDDERILFVREDVYDDGLIKILESRFDRAAWCCAWIDPISDHDFGWKSDFGAWDAALAALGVELDVSIHPEFRPMIMDLRELWMR